MFMMRAIKINFIIKNLPARHLPEQFKYVVSPTITELCILLGGFNI